MVLLLKQKKSKSSLSSSTTTSLPFFPYFSLPSWRTSRFLKVLELNLLLSGLWKPQKTTETAKLLIGVGFYDCLVSGGFFTFFYQQQREISRKTRHCSLMKENTEIRMFPALSFFHTLTNDTTFSIRGLWKISHGKFEAPRNKSVLLVIEVVSRKFPKDDPKKKPHLTTFMGYKAVKRRFYKNWYESREGFH